VARAAAGGTIISCKLGRSFFFDHICKNKKGVKEYPRPTRDSRPRIRLREKSHPIRLYLANSIPLSSRQLGRSIKLEVMLQTTVGKRDSATAIGHQSWSCSTQEDEIGRHREKSSGVFHEGEKPVRTPYLGRRKKKKLISSAVAADRDEK